MEILVIRVGFCRSLSHRDRVCEPLLGEEQVKLAKDRFRAIGAYFGGKAIGFLPGFGIEVMGRKQPGLRGHHFRYAWRTAWSWEVSEPIGNCWVVVRQ